MRRGSKFLIGYFLVFGVLSAIAVIPTAALMVLILTAMALPLFGVPGFLVIASPTILIYSAALVPLWLAFGAPRFRFGLAAVALLIPAAIAVGPSRVSREEARLFATQMSKDDMSRPAAAKPKSIELNGDGTSGLFVYAQTVGDKNASCNEICRRLLFNGEVDWVRMTRTPDIYMNRRGGTTTSVTYRIEHRESCPQAYPDGTQIEKAVRDRLIAGDCLIVEAGGGTAPDATVKFTTRYFNQSYPSKPPENGPQHAIVVTVKDLRIENRQNGALVPALQQTETVALTLAMPFYIGSEMHMQGGYNGPTIGREKTVTKPVDLAQTLRDTFGFKIGEIAAPPPEDVAKIAERILALPADTGRAFSTPQQDALNDVLVAMAKQPALSDADVDFVRRIIADHRATEAKLGVVLQTMFRKYSVRLEPLIPVVLERIGTPVPESVGHYQSLLGWSLANYSADILRPYRDKMIAVAESQAEWPTNGVLTRLAELGGDDAVNLVIRRLDSNRVRTSAATAACRASAEAWPVLEPAVMAHLTPPRTGNTLQDDERLLLLALVRFGKKELVADMIEKRGLFDTKRTLERLAKFEPGFGPELCRNGL